MVAKPINKSVEEFLSDVDNETDLLFYFLDLPNFKHMDLEKTLPVFNIWKYDLAAEFLRMRQLH